MLIHPWDAALDDGEWRTWLAGTDRVGLLAVDHLDLAAAQQRRRLAGAGDRQARRVAPAEGRS